MTVIVALADEGGRRQLRGGNVGADDGVFHMQQTIVVTTRSDPAYAQARRDGFGKRTAQ